MIITWELRYPQKRKVKRKRAEVGGGGWELYGLFYLRGGKWLTWWKESFGSGTKGTRKLYQLTIKKTSSKTVVKDFSYTLRVPSNNCFKSIASQSIALLRISFSLHHSAASWGITLRYFFSSNIIYLGQRETIKVQILRLSNVGSSLSQFLLKFYIVLQCYDT